MIQHQPRSTRYDKPIEDAVNGFFIVDVKSFKSGNNRMNQDMYQALKSERHPNIEFNLKAVDFRYLDTNEALFTVYGYLQVAGVENLISFQVKVSRAGKELYRLQGDKEIYMSDYDIEPPEALFGLVQTRDKLTVEFNLIAGLQSGESLASRLPCDKLPAYLQWGLLEQDINRF
ncbi:MAG: YceI family protein [candidate division KSB1 bacterium]|nr:YceI family protein [candidate division KSB1 bacterium]